MTRAASILALSEHTGWTYLAAISAESRRAMVLIRRRLALIDRDLPTQPYEHDTRGMRTADADELIANVKASAARSAHLALSRVVDDLAREHPVAALTIRKPPLEKLPATVEEVHASHRLLSCADGVLFNLAIRGAAKKLGITVVLYKRGEEFELAAAALKTSAAAVEAFVTSAGRPAGPPWTVEHRRAYAAGIAALAPHVRGLNIK